MRARICCRHEAHHRARPGGGSNPASAHQPLLGSQGSQEEPWGPVFRSLCPGLRGTACSDPGTLHTAGLVIPGAEDSGLCRGTLWCVETRNLVPLLAQKPAPWPGLELCPYPAFDPVAQGQGGSSFVHTARTGGFWGLKERGGRGEGPDWSRTLGTQSRARCLPKAMHMRACLQLPCGALRQEPPTPGA